MPSAHDKLEAESLKAICLIKCTFWWLTVRWKVRSGEADQELLLKERFVVHNWKVFTLVKMKCTHRMSGTLKISRIRHIKQTANC